MIVGLGNPGQKYQQNRHNVGFWFLDKILATADNWRSEPKFHSDFASIKIHGEVVFFVKPQNFMNCSGQAVGAVARYFKIAPEEILVVHDELDFAAGIVRLKKGGGHGGHNGLKDIIANIGCRDFVRLRIGIGRPSESSKASNYVLSAPLMPERGIILQAMEQVVVNIDWLYKGEFEQFMRYLH